MADENSQSNNAKDDANEVTTSFTVETEFTGFTDIPNVTKLLNRKSLTARSPALATSPPETAPSPPTPQVSKVLPAKRRSANHTPHSHPPASAPTQALSKWEATLLEKNPDPLAQAILNLLNQGAGRLLYLNIQKSPTGSPAFCALGCAGSSAQSELWQGFSWEPGQTPQLWVEFVKRGQVCLDPQSPESHLFGTKLGASPTDKIWLIRVGSPQACRGALVILTSPDAVLTIPELNTDRP